MKIVKLWASFLIVSGVAFSSASAIDQASVAFPYHQIGLPALSLSDVARENLPPMFKSFPPALLASQQKNAPSPKSGDDKFVIKPDETVAYKLTIKPPDPSVDYRLLVKNPEGREK